MKKLKNLFLKIIKENSFATNKMYYFFRNIEEGEDSVELLAAAEECCDITKRLCFEFLDWYSSSEDAKEILQQNKYHPTMDGSHKENAEKLNELLFNSFLTNLKLNYEKSNSY